MSNTNAIMIAIVWLIAVTIITVFVGAGMREPQPFMGLGTDITERFSSILQFHEFRYLLDSIMNPFQISPTRGQYEVTPDDAPVRPDQAFDIEIRGTETAILDQAEALIIFVKVTNMGSISIEEMIVELDLGGTFSGCLQTDKATASSSPFLNRDTIHNIAPGASVEVVFRGTLDGRCMRDAAKGITTFRANENIGGVSLKATAETKYMSTSRLSVERIEQSHAQLLMGNNVLRQSRVGAIFRAGTAVTIDMDIGEQPIIVPSGGTSGGLIMRYTNVGRGDIGGEPSLIIVTPKDFGTCKPPGRIDAVCSGEANYNTELGRIEDAVDKYMPRAIGIIDWIKTAEDRYNACILSKEEGARIEEFELITCTVRIPPLDVERRVTEYITAIAVYDYERSSSSLNVRTFCIDTKDIDWCSE